MNTFDVFISYASEDNMEVARPLAEYLQRAGMRVWLDEFELKIGDSLREKIDLGLSNSHYGVVILSPIFFSKQWTKRELNGLFALEGDQNCILPVWHNIDKADVAKHSPILADRLGVSTSHGIIYVARAIASVVNKNNVTASLANMIDSGPDPKELTYFFTIHPDILPLCVRQYGVGKRVDYAKVALEPFHVSSHILSGTDGSVDFRNFLFLPSKNAMGTNSLISMLDNCEQAVIKANEEPKQTASMLLGSVHQILKDYYYFPHFRGEIFLGRRGELSEQVKETIRRKQQSASLLNIMSYDRLLEVSASLESNTIKPKSLLIGFKQVGEK